jgi:hypothetical protein
MVQSLYDELDQRFPSQEILDAIGIIYPQYWRQEGAEESLAQHLLVFKKIYSYAKLVNEGKPLVEGGNPYKAPLMLLASTLTIKANYEVACAPPFHINLLTKLWSTLSQ